MRKTLVNTNTTKFTEVENINLLLRDPLEIPPSKTGKQYAVYDK